MVRSTYIIITSSSPTARRSLLARVAALLRAAHALSPTAIDVCELPVLPVRVLRCRVHRDLRRPHDRLLLPVQVLLRLPGDFGGGVA